MINGFLLSTENYKVIMLNVFVELLNYRRELLHTIYLYVPCIEKKKIVYCACVISITAGKKRNYRYCNACDRYYFLFSPLSCVISSNHNYIITERQRQDKDNERTIKKNYILRKL